ncbi:MAG TPA: hypothetical protein VGJ62_05310 [Gemmatimonadaceae bacterium]
MLGTRSVAIKFGLDGPIAFVIGLALWLSAHSDAPRQNIGDPTAARAAATTLAPPSVPVRLGTLSLAATSHVVRGTARWLAPSSSPHSSAGLVLGGKCAMPSENGRVPSNALALTFPYDATAPPAFIRS